MMALLQKDIYVLVRQMKIFLLLILVFAVIPGYSVSAFAIMYASMLPVTAMAYDERSKWDSLAVMMPYRPLDLVLSKYLLGYGAVIGAMLLSALAQALISAVQGSVISPEYYASALTTLVMALLLVAFTLPCLFKLGVERGRIAFFLMIAAFVAASVLWGDAAVTGLTTVSLSLPLLAVVALLLCLILNAASICLSVAFYRRKEK